MIFFQLVKYGISSDISDHYRGLGESNSCLPRYLACCQLLRHSHFGVCALQSATALSSVGASRICSLLSSVSTHPFAQSTEISPFTGKFIRIN